MLTFYANIANFVCILKKKTPISQRLSREDTYLELIFVGGLEKIYKLSDDCQAQKNAFIYYAIQNFCKFLHFSCSDETT